MLHPSMARPHPSRRTEHGTLLEKQCLVAMLCIAGAVLGPRWRPAFLLVPLGLLLAFLPAVADLLGGWSDARAARTALTALTASGFRVDLTVKAPASEGGTLVAVDRAGGRLAFVTAEGTTVLPWDQVAAVVLASQSWSSFGRGRWIRYVVQVTPKDGAAFGLSFPRRWRARRAFAALSAALCPAVHAEDQTA